MSNVQGYISDEKIVAEILKGNIQSFAVIVNNTEKLVTLIVRRMIDNEDDQKDLVQDIYLKAYQGLGSFQFKSKLSTWIATIAYNTSINYLRKSRVAFTGMESEMGDSTLLEANPESAVMSMETTEILQAALARLPPLPKTLITLYHLEELSLKEISEITRIPEGTIKSYLFRARKTLRDDINRQLKNHG